MGDMTASTRGKRQQRGARFGSGIMRRDDQHIGQKDQKPSERAVQEERRQ